MQPELHVVVPFSGGPVSGFAKRGTDGAVWSWGTFLQIYSEARDRGEHQLSRFLTVFQPETGPRKGRPNRRKSTCALRAMQCRNGIAGGIARLLGLVSGALRRLERLKMVAVCLRQSGVAVWVRCGNSQSENSGTIANQSYKIMLGDALN